MNSDLVVGSHETAQQQQRPLSFHSWSLSNCTAMVAATRIMFLGPIGRCGGMVASTQEVMLPHLIEIDDA
jgi:hypothetical protein